MTASTIGAAPLLADDPQTVSEALRREGWQAWPSCGPRKPVTRREEYLPAAWTLTRARWVVVDCAASSLFVVEFDHLGALSGLLLAPAGPATTRMSRSPEGAWTAWWSSPDGISSADLRLPPGVIAPPGQLAYAPPSPPAPSSAPRTRRRPAQRHRWVLPLVDPRPLPQHVLDLLTSRKDPS